MNKKYNELLESLADLNQTKQIVNRAFKREFEVLEQYDSPEKNISNEAFLFSNPFSGELEKYAFRTTTIEDLKLLTAWHKNSQYCWLLMSAYEKFEQFLESSYFEATGKKSRTLNKILLYFSDNFSSVKFNEANNKFEINLRIAVHLVEKMRHAITHNQGYVDIEKFTKKVISDSGLGEDRILYGEFISQFILEDKVFILEIPTTPPPLIVYHNQYEELVNYLVSYAYLVKGTFSKPST